MKVACAQAQTQCVWSKTSWKSLEQIHGPGDEVHWIYPQQI